MRRALLALALLLPLAASAQEGFPIGPGPGQLPGTATNDSAATGNVGQIITASTGATSLTNNTAANGTSQSITAGDWDIWCSYKFTPAATTTITSVIGELTSTSATLALTLGNYHEFSYQAASTAGAVPLAFSTPQVPVSLVSTTTYYCVSYSTFAVSTMTVDAKLVARRRR